MTYQEKFKSPLWQRKRLEVMGRDNFKCRRCSDTTNQLNVHHLYYVSGRMPWEYPNAALITLCHTCHEMVGASSKDGDFGWERFLCVLIEYKNSEIIARMLPALKSNGNDLAEILPKIDAAVPGPK